VRPDVVAVPPAVEEGFDRVDVIRPEFGQVRADISG
jgi:hypothetical protein